MILTCPTCGHPIILALRPLDRNRSVQGTGPCRTCHAIYAVDVKELKATDWSEPELDARKNRTSNGRTT